MKVKLKTKRTYIFLALNCVFFILFHYTKLNFTELQTVRIVALKEIETENLDIKGYVLSLPNVIEDPDRLSRFRKNWNNAYPDLEIYIVETEVAARGVGVVKGSIQAFEHAIENNIDVALIFEDDATPFRPDPNVTSLSWKDQFLARFKVWPESSFTLFLGSHHIQGDSSERAQCLGVGRISLGYGAYAYVVRRHHFKQFLEYFQTLLIRSNKRRDKKLNGDLDWWSILFSDKNPAYLTLPLLVDHPDGYSSTWEWSRSDVWSGTPNWWEITSWEPKHKKKKQNREIRVQDFNITNMRGYVLSLQNNTDDPLRLQRFLDQWRVAFPELGFEVIHTHPGPRGVGVVLGSVKALEHAKENRFEVALIFEDDGLPFLPDNSSNQSWADGFIARLKVLPHNAGALFLGAHHINGDKSLSAIEKGISKVKNALGAYAYVILPHRYDLLLNFFYNELDKLEPGGTLSADYTWWKGVTGIFHRPNPAFITMPLLVDHAPGFSATWNKKRSAPWAGDPIWWKIQYWKLPK